MKRIHVELFQRSRPSRFGVPQGCGLRPHFLVVEAAGVNEAVDPPDSFDQSRSFVT